MAHSGKKKWPCRNRSKPICLSQLARAAPPSAKICRRLIDDSRAASNQEEKHFTYRKYWKADQALRLD